MQYFLQLVARDLYREFGNDLSHTVVLFPNKRASLFLNEYLGQLATAPVWAPRYLSISELFTSLSDKTVADPIESVCRLYRHYAELTGNDERLDYFYGWGERLLADFDDVDKNMADPAKLFRDLRDYAALGGSEVLDEEQFAQLRKLSSDFAGQQLTSVQQRFNRLWGQMPQLYERLRAELSAAGLAYEGQLYREVAEGLADETLTWPAAYRHVAVVGFNVIDRVEHTLFSYLQRRGLARFYWDYDSYYASPSGGSVHEAGVFIEQNLRDFPNALPESDFDNFRRDRAERTIEVASAQTELAQAQSVTAWLQDPRHFDPREAKRTAVVMCNETLLQPVLHALPDTVGEVNVTKGFPLGHTPAFACVAAFAQEVEQRHDEAVAKGRLAPWPEGAACLPTLDELGERLKQAYRDTLAVTPTGDLLRDLYTESFFQAYTLTTRFANFVTSGLLDVQLPTLIKLLRAVMRQTSIPFHGEPAVGLQVMGVLETRCLDFDNVILLSVGEGVLPQRSSDASFIPFLLRKMHGLTTPDRQVSVYAYYFYRLLQRARHVRLCFNESTEGMQRGEMSRFVRALLVEGGPQLGVRHVALEATHQALPPVPPEGLLAPPSYYKRLRANGLSPSALKSFSKCPLQFYYHYVLRLKTPQVNDGIINANDFGTIVHKVAENIFVNELGGDTRSLTPMTLKKFVENNKPLGLARLVGQAFQEVNDERLKAGDDPIPDSLIARHAVLKYVSVLLAFEGGTLGDGGAPALEISQVETEQQHELTIDVPVGDELVPLRLYGYVDRLDCAVLDGHREGEASGRALRIIDYKTGRKSDRDKIASLDALFTDSKSFPENALQVLIYSLMFVDRGLPVVPMLYYIPSMPSKDFTPYIVIGKQPVADFRDIADDFRDRLVSKLSELLDPARPFAPTDIKDHCQYCDYRLLCGAKEKPGNF